MRRLFHGHMLVGAVAVASLGGLSGLLSCHPPPVTTEEGLRWGAVAKDAYEAQLFDEVEELIAKDHFSDDGPEAQLLALLLSTRHEVDASRLLGYLARLAHHYDRAEEYARRSIRAAGAAQDGLGEARGATLLAQVLWESGRFADSHDQAKKGAARFRDLIAERSSVSASPEQRTELHDAWISAQIADADALRRAGLMKQACTPLFEAVENREATGCRRAWAKVKLAMCEEESGRNDQAELWLERAREEKCDHEIVAAQIAMNEALQSLFNGEDGKAEEQIDEAAKAIGEEDADVHLHRAYVAGARGQLEVVERELDAADAQGSSDRDWPWVIELARGDLAQRRAELARQEGKHEQARAYLKAAEAAYRASVKEVDRLRAKSKSQSAYLMASHRAPYEGLIALLASQGRAEEALEVLHALDASDMLRTAAHPAQASLPAPSSKALMQAWRGKNVAILVAPAPRMLWDKDHAYRLLIQDGRVSVKNLGLARELLGQIEALLAGPDKPEAAVALGKALVSADVAGRPLRVLALGSAAQLPLPLLRRDERSLLQETTPLVQLLSLCATTPPMEKRGEMVVLVGSPGGDLPDSATERDEIAAMIRSRDPDAELRVLGRGAALEATGEELLREPRPLLLHMASHVKTHDLWPAFLLSRGETLDAPQLLRKGLAPFLAVLANCSSLGEEPNERWSSVALAFVEAGTQWVIATRSTVEDGAASALMRALHQEKMLLKDPARALANVQRRAARGKLTLNGPPIPVAVWSAFVVIERPVYVPRLTAAN